MGVASTDEWKGRVVALFEDVREDKASRRHCKSPSEPMTTGQVWAFFRRPAEIRRWLSLSGRGSVIGVEEGWPESCTYTSGLQNSLNLNQCSAS